MKSIYGLSGITEGVSFPHRVWECDSHFEVFKNPHDVIYQGTSWGDISHGDMIDMTLVIEEENDMRKARDEEFDNKKWKEILANNKSIREDQKKHEKYFKKIDNPSGFAFSDLEHLKKVDERLEKNLENLAKKHGYVTEGYTKYQAWLDKTPK